MGYFYAVLAVVSAVKCVSVPRKWQRCAFELKRIRGVLVQKHTAAIFSTPALIQVEASQRGTHRLACRADSINRVRSDVSAMQKSMHINARGF